MVCAMRLNIYSYRSFRNSLFRFRNAETSIWSDSPCCSYSCDSCCVKSDTKFHRFHNLWCFVHCLKCRVRRWYRTRTHFKHNATCWIAFANEHRKQYKKQKREREKKKRTFNGIQSVIQLDMLDHRTLDRSPELEQLTNRWNNSIKLKAFKFPEACIIL